MAAARDGLPVLGICNGFQVLCEAHLLPGALIRNDAPAASSAATSGCGSRRGTAWTDGYRAGAGGRDPDQERRGRLRRRRAHPRRAGGRGPGRRPLPRRQPQRLGPRHRRDRQRRRQRRRPHAAPGARGRPADRPGRRRPRLLHRAGGSPSATGRWRSGGDVDTVERGRGRPRTSPAVRRARPGPGRVRADPRRSSAAGRPRPSWPCTRSCGASTARTSRARCTCASSARRRRRSEPAAGRHRRERRRGRRRRRLAVTFKVESHNHPSLRRALPGRGHRRRRHRPGHPRHGRPPGRGDGPAAVRRRPTHPDTARVLPGVVAGIGGYGNCLGLPNIGGEVVFDPCYQGNPLVNALCVGVLRTDGIQQARGHRRRQRGGPARREDRPGRHRRRVRAGQRHLRRRQASKRPERAGRRPVHGEAAHRVLPGAVRRRSGRRHPGPRRRRADLRADRAAPRRRRRHARRPGAGAAAGAVDEPGGDPGQRVAGADVRDRRAGASWPTSSPSASKWGVLATAIGEVTDDRPAARSTGTASGRRRAAAARSPTTARSTPGRCARPADLDALVSRPGRTCPGRARRTSCGRPLLRMVASPEPVRQDLGHRAVRPVRAGQHRAGPAGGRRRGPHRRGDRPGRRARRSTATAATPGSTRTPGRSWRWPRRTATWPPPAPSRSR